MKVNGADGMITADQITSGEVVEGTRVFYTRKDGSRIRGTVRRVYADKRMLTMRHDGEIGGSQTYRFRRLTVEGAGVEFPWMQLAPLVVMASSRTTPVGRRVIYSSSEGLWVDDGRKVFVERIRGLGDGRLDGSLLKLTKAGLKDGVKYDDSSIIPMEAPPWPEVDLGRKTGSVRTRSREFNRFVKVMEYSSGNYHAKWSDLAMISVDGSGVVVDVLDKKLKLCGTYHAGTGSDGVLKSSGSSKFSCMLHDLREFVKGIRTGVCVIDFHRNGMVIETDEQKRMVYGGL